MNRTEYETENISVERLYSKEGQFVNDEGKSITYKNIYTILEINGKQALFKLEKGFAEMIDDAMVPKGF